MKSSNHMSKLVTIVISALLLISCLLPGMIPLTPIPAMEKNADKVIEVLKGKDWHPLQSLAQEQYTEDDFAQPGTLTFTSPDNLLCLDFGVLISEWPVGEYKLEAVATFDEKVNDGLADYEAGEYKSEYNVTVEK